MENYKIKKEIIYLRIYLILYVYLLFSTIIN